MEDKIVKIDKAIGTMQDSINSVIKEGVGVTDDIKNVLEQLENYKKEIEYPQERMYTQREVDKIKENIITETISKERERQEKSIVDIDYKSEYSKQIETIDRLNNKCQKFQDALINICTKI